MFEDGTEADNIKKNAVRRVLQLFLTPQPSWVATGALRK
jgi:hypothetical protein